MKRPATDAPMDPHAWVGGSFSIPSPSGHYKKIEIQRVQDDRILTREWSLRRQRREYRVQKSYEIWILLHSNRGSKWTPPRRKHLTRRS